MAHRDVTGKWIACWLIGLAAAIILPAATAQDPLSTETTPLGAMESEQSLEEDLATPSLGSTSEVALPVPTAPKDPLLFEHGPTRVKFSLDAVAQQSGVTGSWWNLSEQFAPDAEYKLDRAWAETWIKPGVRLDTVTADWLTLYAGVSYVGSGNIGRDVFEQGNRGLWSVEDAYLGARFDLPEDAAVLDVSYGRQQYRIGSGMLIAVGALNGFERGATTTFARRAWEEAGIVKLTRGSVSLNGFYLNPNELLSASTNTRLAGTHLDWNPDANRSLGIAYFNVFDSIYPYVAAPIQLIPEGRRGLNTLHVYGRWNPLVDAFPGWHIAGDYAHQWKDRITMVADAYNAETGYSFAQLPLAPRLAYAFRFFSGDDPTTSQFEKFDPLFYEGAPPSWASGSNGSFSFLNSNIIAHRISCNLTINPRNFMAFYYWHILVDEVNSPVQFGQAGRFVVSGGEPSLVAGVPVPQLSDDFYVEYTRLVTPQCFVTSGVAVSVPGEGLRELVDDPKTWVGCLLNLTVKY